jgi:amino acid adenylation domain-containing protein
VRETALDAYAHQDVPFEQVVRHLTPQRDLSRSPLFQAMFTLQHVPSSEWQAAELSFRLLPASSCTAKCDLTLLITEAGGRLEGVWEYNTDLFDPPTIARLDAHFAALLEGAVSGPGQRISALPLMGAPELSQVLAEATGPVAPYPEDLFIHRMVERQAARTPEAVAVVCGSERMSYADLVATANQLAHHLRRLGVGPEVRVGVCLAPSIEMMLAVLAVLEAGGAYVPLDPEHPDERLAQVVLESSPAVLLTTRRQAGRWAAAGVPVVCLDEDAWRDPRLCAAPECFLRPDNLAFLIYTSGSTGTPRGVMGLHRCLMSRFHAEMFPFAPAEVCCVKTGLVFIDSIWEMFMPLTLGLRTVIVPEATRRDAAALLRLLADEGVTRLMFVPSLLRALLDVCPDLGSRLPRLKYWYSGGEALPADLCTRFRRAHPEAILINGYGLSEAWDVTAHRCADVEYSGRVPVGHLFANTEVYLLDADLRPVPLGVPGEVHVGGAGLARGYLGRPGWTAARWVPHPFSRVPGQRLYRTGDLARRLPDGGLEFLGRADHQLKVRGQRVEPGEIESVLRRHPAIKEAVVLLRDFGPGDGRLVAYAVARQTPPDSVALAAEVRRSLGSCLPPLLVPSAVVLVDALPRTPGGKIDRLELARRPLPAAQERAIVPPHIPTEEVLAALWAGQLGLERIGIHDSFFDLGGHSLSAMQMLARLRSEFEVELPLSALFAGPTVAQMADRVDAARQAGANRCLPRSLRRAGARHSPCRTLRSVCGSWTVCGRAAPPTTSRRLCVCGAAWTWPPCTGPSTRWSAATRPCAPPSPCSRAARCRSLPPAWTCPWRSATSASCRRSSGKRNCSARRRQRRGGPSICRQARSCGWCCCGWLTRTTPPC